MQYKEAQDAFLDVIDPKSYISLQHSATIYKSLRTALKKPLKMILLYGEPGTGKSMMLHKLYDDLKDKQTIFLYDTPLDIEHFLERLSIDLLGKSETSLTKFIEQCKEKLPQIAPIILLDEAQLYDEKLMETIRLISDSRKIRFVITLHKTEEEDLIAKAHFQTRIWESFELKNATIDEIERYIQNKLLQLDLPDLLDILNKDLIHLVYKYSHGNLRNTHMLLYQFLDLLQNSEKSKTAKELLETAAKKSNLEKKESKKQPRNNKNYKNFLMASSMAIVLAIGGYTLISKTKVKPNNIEKIEKVVIKQIPIKPNRQIEVKKYNPQILQPSYSFLDEIDEPYTKPIKESTKEKIVEEKNSMFKHAKASSSQLEDLLLRYKDNKNSKIATHIANSYFQKQNFKDAYRYSLEANELDPSSQASWIVTAKSLFKMNKKKDAVRILRSYLSAYQSKEIKTLLFKMLSGEYK